MDVLTHTCTHRHPSSPGDWLNRMQWNSFTLKMVFSKRQSIQSVLQCKCEFVPGWSQWLYSLTAHKQCDSAVTITIPPHISMCQGVYISGSQTCQKFEDHYTEYWRGGGAPMAPQQLWCHRDPGTHPLCEPPLRCSEQQSATGTHFCVETATHHLKGTGLHTGR